MLPKATLVSWLFVIGVTHTCQLAAQLTGTFTPTANMNSPRFLHTATLLTDGRVLIAGGYMIEATGWNTLSSAEIYDPGTGTFTPTGSMATPRAEATATLLPDGMVLIAGGGIYNNGTLANPALASAEIYDPSTGTFAPTGSMAIARGGPTATLLNNGKVLIAGGVQGGGATFKILSSAELYDPSTGTFTATGNMTSWADTATLLPNGKVLITRGNPDGPAPYLSSADLYDPSTCTFTSVGYLTVNHTGPTANLVMNGKVLIAGGDYGDGDGGSAVTEVYDPTAGGFTKSGLLIVGREQNSLTLLPDGTVLFAGGHNVSDLAASAETFDPAKATSNRTASMSRPRELHTATLLNDGRVLIAGGDSEQDLASAELYTPPMLLHAPMLYAPWHAETGQLASSANPATAGDILSMYTTSLFEGGAIPPQVAISGQLAEVLFFGDAPGYPGYYQVNFRVPSAVAPRPSVPVRLTYIGRSSNEVTIGVR
jgi:Kelch motif